MEHFILEDGSYFTGDPEYRPDGKEEMVATIVPIHPPYPADWNFEKKEWVVNESEFLTEMEDRRTIDINTSIRESYTLEHELKVLREAIVSGITADFTTMNDDITTIITDNPKTTKETINDKIAELTTGDSVGDSQVISI